MGLAESAHAGSLPRDAAVASREPLVGSPAFAGGAPPRTAFVLSGGASLGAMQVGMLQALYEQRIEPDLLVATSAGALNAAFVASRPQTPATARKLGRIWNDLRREDVFPVRMSAVVRALAGRRDHLMPDRQLRALIDRHIEFDDLAEAAIPLHLVAFDLSGGAERLLSDGPATEAVAASAAIPGLFPPVAIGEARLVDGGVINNTPISHAVELGAERIYVLPTQDRGSRAARSQGALDAAIYALGLLIDNRLEADLIRYSREAEIVVLPAPNAAAVQPTSFEHSARLINEALRAARTSLAPGHTGRGLRLAT